MIVCDYCGQPIEDRNDNARLQPLGLDIHRACLELWKTEAKKIKKPESGK